MPKEPADTFARVVWHDACGGKTGWMARPQAVQYRPYVVESYGWLIRNDKDVVTLAISRHRHQDGSFYFADTLDVPRGMVQSVTRLKGSARAG